MTSNFSLSLRQKIREISGGFGDLGILLPLTIILITYNGLSATTVFFFVGLHYLITGYYFKIPLPVQPMKAMAMIAIATGASAQAIGAAGIMIGGLLLLLAATPLVNLLHRLFTTPIIRGIQLSVGLFLIDKGIELITAPNAALLSFTMTRYNLGYSVLLAAITGMLIIALSNYKKIPATLIILPFGILAGLIFIPSHPLPTLDSRYTLPAMIFPSTSDFITAFFLLVIPQIPLTIANSIISTSHIAHDYYAQRANRVTPRSLCTSLGIGNFIGGFFGALPCCHGAGGLTAHYKFGARTGQATVFIGFIFILAGLIFGDSVLHLFTLIPAAVLGALLIYVGIEHGMMIKDAFADRQSAFIVLLIAGISIGSHNIAIGFAIGMAAGLLFKLFPSIMTNDNK